MGEDNTTSAVHKYLQDLGDQGPSDVAVRALLQRSLERLQMLSSTMLFRRYPRLTRPPMNLEADELLSAVVERLIKALSKVRPKTTRQFFALANQHIRWELNDLARWLDQKGPAVELHEEFVASPETSGSVISPNASRMFEAIDSLPEYEREVFELVRIQGLTHPETAEVLCVSTKTVQRRLNRSLLLLTEQLSDLFPAEEPTAKP